MNVFALIPGFSGYQIDTTGCVHCFSTGEMAFGYRDANGYTMIRVTHDQGESVIVGVYRLLALAFIPIPPGIENPIPNHVDGNKQNNDLENLEWTTYSGNILHAYQTGLRTDNRHIEIMNEQSREVTSFYSMGECGRFFGVEAGAIHWQLNARKWPGPYKGHFLKYADDSTPWPEQGLSYRKQTLAVVLTHVETGVVERYESLDAATRRLGCNNSSCVSFQARKPTPTPYRGYLIRMADLSGSEL